MARADPGFGFPDDWLASGTAVGHETQLDALMADFSRSPLPARSQAPFLDGWPYTAQPGLMLGGGGGHDMYSMPGSLQQEAAEQSWTNHIAFADQETGRKRKFACLDPAPGLQRLVIPPQEPDSGESSAEIMQATPRVPTSPKQQVEQTPVKRTNSASTLKLSPFSVVKGNPCDPKGRDMSLAEVNRRIALFAEADTPTCSQTSQGSPSPGQPRPHIKVNGVPALSQLAEPTFPPPPHSHW